MAKAYWVAKYSSFSNPEDLAAYAKISGPAIVAAAADSNAGLVRMVRGSASLEDLFLEREATR